MIGQVGRAGILTCKGVSEPSLVEGASQPRFAGVDAAAGTQSPGQNIPGQGAGLAGAGPSRGVGILFQEQG